MPCLRVEGLSVTQSRQQFENRTNQAIFITIEPWCWRYRIEPGDAFEVFFSLECPQEDWSPLEVHVGMEGDKTGLFIFVNGNVEPKLLLNGVPAEPDFESG
jgi:hypothetical protein